jgi:hypothetical protein
LLRSVRPRLCNTYRHASDGSSSCAWLLELENQMPSRSPKSTSKHRAVMQAIYGATILSSRAVVCDADTVVAAPWRVYDPLHRHSTHQSSELGQVTPGFRSSLAPYQEIPLTAREPVNLPPYAGTAVTPECVEVYQDGFSLSARNQREVCADWAIGTYWAGEEVENDRIVWVGRGMARIRYVQPTRQQVGGWWIHRDLDRHGLPCRGDGSSIGAPDPLGCQGFGDVHWSPCKVRRCLRADNARLRHSDGGGGLEAKISSLRTTQLRKWAVELGLEVTSHDRRDIIAVKVREHLYSKDGHQQLDPADEFLQVADQWAAARTAEMLALEALEALADDRR